MYKFMTSHALRVRRMASISIVRRVVMKAGWTSRTTIGGTAAALMTALSIGALIIGKQGQAEAGEPSESTQLSRGRYLVKIAGCNDCHTEDYALKAGAVNESEWLTGSSVGWEGPWGTTYPPNLRQLMQGLTREQWLAYARKPTRPPMPWFALRDMSDNDLAAIYGFVRSLGSAGSPAPAFEPPKQQPPATTGPLKPLKRWKAE
jgi:mono/diheme cytochrome c family protein